MIGSHLDSERLLAAVHGLARWSTEEAAHLERCAGCRLESELVGAARTLGRVPAERVDASRAAAAVARRLRTAPVSSPGGLARPARWVLALAAAAAVALAVIYPGAGTHGTDAQLAVLHELDGLTTAELEAVLETILPSADAALHVEAAPIGDLSEKGLERMLQSME